MTSDNENMKISVGKKLFDILKESDLEEVKDMYIGGTFECIFPNKCTSKLISMNNNNISIYKGDFCNDSIILGIGKEYISHSRYEARHKLEFYEERILEELSLQGKVGDLVGVSFRHIKNPSEELNVTTLCVKTLENNKFKENYYSSDIKQDETIDPLNSKDISLYIDTMTELFKIDKEYNNNGLEIIESMRECLLDKYSIDSDKVINNDISM